jgi:MoxR-like ATPase
MDTKTIKSLVPGMKVKYIAQTTSTRVNGAEYTIESVNGNFIKHNGINGLQVEGHVGQYQLISPISEPVPSPKFPDIEVPVKPLTPFYGTVATLPAVTAPSKDEVDFKRLLKDNQDLSTKVLTMALEQGQRLAKDMISTVQGQLDEVRRNSCQVLKVQINDTDVKDIKTQAVPFLKRMIVSAKIGKNIMLVGPAGCGKTTAASQLAEAMGVTFYHNTVTAGASETWFLGRQTPNGFQPGPLHLAYKLGGVYLADEYDAGDANLLIMFNTMLENGHFYNPFNGEQITRHKDFVFVAACNTYGKGADATYTGRNRLDAASLRRFAGSTIAVDYDKDIERLVCPDDGIRKALQDVRKSLKDLNSTEIVSTGCLKNTYDLVQQGIPFKDVAESLALSWPEDLKKLMTNAISQVKGGQQ